MKGAATLGDHTRPGLKAAGDGGELGVVELEVSVVTTAGSRTVRAGLLEAQGAGQSVGLGENLKSHKISSMIYPYLS